jgi:hypothetical protein
VLLKNVISNQHCKDVAVVKDYSVAIRLLSVVIACNRLQTENIMRNFREMKFLCRQK